MAECRCEQFVSDLDSPCPVHSLEQEKESGQPEYLPNAYTTLPAGLILAELPETGEKAIFASRELPAGAIYGPLEGILAGYRQKNSTASWAVGSSSEGFLDFWLDNDDVTNWMKFVRMDRDPQVQNLEAHQDNRNVYFTIVRDIQEGEELKVWYSKEYEKELSTPWTPLIQLLPVQTPQQKPRTRDYLQKVHLASSKGYVYRCDDCDAAFRIEALLDYHKTQHDNRLIFAKNGVFACPGCRLVLTSKEEFVRHVDLHMKKNEEKELIVPCPHCEKRFVSEASMQLHSRQIHAINPKEEKACEACGKILRNQAAYVSHMKVHSDTKTGFRCAVCSEEFKMSVQVQEHSLSHCVDDRFPCPACEKSYDTFQTLTYHIRSVHGDRNCLCKICGYSFVDRHRLARHMQIHSQEFNFKCEICEQLFKDREKLTRHRKRVHDPDKPSTSNRKVRVFDGVSKPRSSEDYMTYVYRCMECKLGFHQRRLLLRHLQERHPAKDPGSVPELNLPVVEVEMHPCSRCYRKYTSVEGLMGHFEKEHPDEQFVQVENHSAESSGSGSSRTRETCMFYVCAICDQRFWSAGKLLKHGETRHPGVNLLEQSAMEYQVLQSVSDPSPN